MATYLLKCSDERMATWKAAAADAGYTLAEWLRAAADDRAADEHGAAAADSSAESPFTVPLVDEVDPGVTMLGRRIPLAASTAHAERMFRGPDPKPSSRKRK